MTYCKETKKNTQNNPNLLGVEPLALPTAVQSCTGMLELYGEWR